MKDYYKVLLDNITSYSGSGLLLVLLLVAIFFLFFKEKDKNKRKMLVAYPILVLAVMFCPLWTIYIAKRDDAVILYRLFWIIPSVIIVSYALVEAISLLPKKRTPFFMAGAVALIALCGRYIYANQFFSKAQNEYHISNTVVEICDRIIVPGREVRACFPEEFVQSVRQYTSLVLLPYGRGVLLEGSFEDHNDIKDELIKDVVDSEVLCGLLRDSGTQYLVVDAKTVFSNDLSKYDYIYKFSIDGYDIYLDDLAYLGLDYNEAR